MKAARAGDVLAMGRRARTWAVVSIVFMCFDGKDGASVARRLESPRPFEAEAMGSGTGYAIAAETAFLTVDPWGLIQIDLAGFDHPWQS